MNKDLKLIKKYYGEDMMHYCRDNFPTLVEENKMYEILNDHFYHNKFLYNDLKENNLFSDFNNYINSFKNKEKTLEDTLKTPTELLSDIGYNLYECKSEKDIQAFRKYYASGEELCTFNDNRLNKCYVFFAVKKDVDKIKRKNFKNPERQDEYGTSVISIQFSKNDDHILSIKNRYNHTVNNPDNTFNNNLDNIIPGLTNSFEHYYGLKPKYINNDFDIPSYVFFHGKYYKYNIKKHEIYYCIDNIIIENDKLKQYDKEKYIVMDDFILDLVNKEICEFNYDIRDDAFLDIPRNIEKIDVINTDYGKRITLFNKDKTFEVILLNKENNIIGYVNNFVKTIDDYFLFRNEKLKHLELNNVLTIGNNFLSFNQVLNYLELNNVLSIGNNFLSFNQKLQKVNLPKVIKIGDDFIYYNSILDNISLPNCENIGNNFLKQNQCLKEINFSNLKTIGDNFLLWNSSIKEVYLYNLLQVGTSFLECNKFLKKIYIPKCVNVEDDYFLKNNINSCEILISLELSKNIFNNGKKFKNVFIVNDNKIKALKKSLFNPIYNKTLTKSLKKHIN